MAVSEKTDFILCEIKSSLFDASDHRNGYITAVRSVCDSYQLFGIKVNFTAAALCGSHRHMECLLFKDCKFVDFSAYFKSP